MRQHFGSFSLALARPNGARRSLLVILAEERVEDALGFRTGLHGVDLHVERLVHVGSRLGIEQGEKAHGKPLACEW